MHQRAEQEIMQHWKDDVTKPIVSISTITYNHENYIAQTLDGLLMQETEFAFEILINEDASTDNTASIIKEYEKKYPKIIKPLYQSENQYSKGISMSPTFNFPRAQGKYIAMCEGDDYWTDPLKLQRQVDLLEANKDFSGVHHKVNYVDKDSNLLGVSDRVEKGFEVVDYKYLAQRNTIHTCSFMFKKEILDQSFYDIMNKAPVGDLVLFLKASLEGKIAYIDSVMGVYRQNVGVNITWSKEKNYFNVLAVYKLFDSYLNIKSITNISKHYIYFKLSNTYSNKGEFLKALESFLQSFYYMFFVITTNEYVVNKVSFGSVVKTGIFTIPYMRKILLKIKKIVVFWLEYEKKVCISHKLWY